PERASVGAGTEPEDGDHARGRPAGSLRTLAVVEAHDRAQDLETERVQDLTRDALAPQSHGVRGQVDGHAHGRARGQPARRAHVVGPVRGPYEQAPPPRLQLAHLDEQRGVEDLLPAHRRVQGGREVQERDQLGHALEERAGLPRSPEIVERALVLEDDGNFHQRPGDSSSALSLCLTRAHTLRRAERRNVTESMIFSMRCMPRPPVRRSVTNLSRSTWGTARGSTICPVSTSSTRKSGPRSSKRSSTSRSVAPLYACSSTFVAASSTARESRSATGSEKPATSAIFFVTSRTRPRYAVSLGSDRTRAGLLRPRGD